MKKIILTSAAALITGLCAMAQPKPEYVYQGDVFYIHIYSAADIRIGSTTPSLRFVTEDEDDDESVVEVNVYEWPAAIGYSQVRDDIDDADFFISDDSTEIKSQDLRQAKSVINALRKTVKHGASIGFYKADATKKDRRTEGYINLPREAVIEICDAWKNISKR